MIYIYIYICSSYIYIYMYMHIYMYISRYIHVHVYTHICMYIYIHVYIYIYIYNKHTRSLRNRDHGWGLPWPLRTPTFSSRPTECRTPISLFGTRTALLACAERCGYLRACGLAHCDDCCKFHADAMMLPVLCFCAALKRFVFPASLARVLSLRVNHAVQLHNSYLANGSRPESSNVSRAHLICVQRNGAHEHWDWPQLGGQEQICVQRSRWPHLTLTPKSGRLDVWEPAASCMPYDMNVMIIYIMTTTTTNIKTYIVCIYIYIYTHIYTHYIHVHIYIYIYTCTYT